MSKKVSKNRKRKVSRYSTKKLEHNKKIKKKEYQPWEVPELKKVEISQLIPSNLSLDERIKIVKDISEKADDIFIEKYDKLKIWFEEYDAIYLLSFCIFYFSTSLEGVDPEVNGTLELHPHLIEILQAFSLMKKRTITPKPLREKANQLKDDLVEIDNAMRQRLLKLPDNTTEKDDIYIHFLRTEMMISTMAIRNWAYSRQIKKTLFDLISLINTDLIRVYRVDFKYFFNAYFKLIEDRNLSIQKHVENIREYWLKDNYSDVIKSYYEKIIGREVNESEIEELWVNCENNIENLKYFLMEHSDLHKTKLFTFNIKYFSELYGEAIDINVLKNLLDNISYCFGDLEFNNSEYFILDNPVHNKPFIKISDTEYFSSIYNIFYHIVMGVFENLIAEDDGLKKKYENTIKPKYLESQIDRLFIEGFPNSKIYRNVKWYDPISNKDFETDLIVVIDTFLLVVEAKSGNISPTAKRGDPKSLSKTIKRLIEDPSEQANRLIKLLKNNKKEHKFSCKGGEVIINSNKIDYYIPLGITFSQFSIMCNIKKLVQSKIISLPINEISTTMNFADLECVFDLLPLESQKIHYLIWRKKVDKYLHYEGDELDLLGYYLDNGFSVGKSEFEKEEFKIITLYSKRLDPYFESIDKEIDIEKPSIQCTGYWRIILERLATKKSPKWLEFSYILLCFSIDDQKRIIDSIEKLKKQYKPLGNNYFTYIVGAGKEKYQFIAVLYEDLDTNQRNFLMDQILKTNKHPDTKGEIIVGYNIKKPIYPYNVLAGGLKTDLLNY